MVQTDNGVKLIEQIVSEQQQQTNDYRQARKDSDFTTTPLSIKPPEQTYLAVEADLNFYRGQTGKMAEEQWRVYIQQPEVKRYSVDLIDKMLTSLGEKDISRTDISQFVDQEVSFALAR